MTAIFHPGEREIQHRTGEAHIADAIKSIVTGTLANNAINFVEKQPMVIVGSRNDAGEPWASLLVGHVGFARVPDPGTIQFDTRQISSNGTDIFFSNLRQDDQIGSLFIELNSRKRLRVNGTCKWEGSLIELKIKHAYPNCPKYIQRRIISMPEGFQKLTSVTAEGIHLTDHMIDWIKGADALFVASAGADGGLDASHRGGNPGFIQLIDNKVLKIPDYPGNSLFNTFGNIVQNPKVGLLLIDFEQKQTLQITGTASLLFDQTSEADLLRTKGTGRYWLFHPSRWLHTIDHHNIEWTFLEYSRFNP
ncbi:MAG: pyridoxamine 5'-phosphate oxidase family protein [Williamsia sp.]|nr:pyridoxamine 5'-phosphate oxidase family protein [Williamsia sp.]